MGYQAWVLTRPDKFNPFATLCRLGLVVAGFLSIVFAFVGAYGILRARVSEVMAFAVWRAVCFFLCLPFSTIVVAFDTPHIGWGWTLLLALLYLALSLSILLL